MKRYLEFKPPPATHDTEEKYDGQFFKSVTQPKKVNNPLADMSKKELKLVSLVQKYLM